MCQCQPACSKSAWVPPVQCASLWSDGHDGFPDETNLQTQWTILFRLDVFGLLVFSDIWSITADLLYTYAANVKSQLGETF